MEVHYFFLLQKLKQVLEILFSLRAFLLEEGVQIINHNLHFLLVLMKN